MRRIFAVCALALFIIVVCTFGIYCVHDFEREMSDIMQQAWDASVQKDYEQAAELADRAEQYFIEKEALIAIFTDHELVENLGSALAKLQPLSAEETIYEFQSELQSARIMLTHIANDQRPVLHNIL